MVGKIVSNNAARRCMVFVPTIRFQASFSADIAADCLFLSDLLFLLGTIAFLKWLQLENDKMKEMRELHNDGVWTSYSNEVLKFIILYCKLVWDISAFNLANDDFGAFSVIIDFFHEESWTRCEPCNFALLSFVCG